MKYYSVNLRNGVLTSQLKDLLDVAKRVGDIIGDYKVRCSVVDFLAPDNNNIEAKLIRNCYDVTQIG